MITELKIEQDMRRGCELKTGKDILERVLAESLKRLGFRGKEQV